MLGHLLTLARGVAHQAATSLVRSSRWRTFRRAWLFHHPECEACGTRKLVEPHHVEPFEHNPARELDDTNLLSLCHSNGCHILFGHGDNFHFYVQRVREIVRQVRAKRISRDMAAAIAKDERVPIRTAA